MIIAFTRKGVLAIFDSPTHDYSIDAVSELTQATVTEGLAQGPYMEAKVGFEPANFRTQGPETTTEPPCPVIMG